MPVGMITVKELLADPQYKKFFTTVPKLPDHYTPDKLPWRLMVLKEGEKAWRSKRFGTYAEAFQGFKTMLPKINDAAINCPGLNFMPPVKHVRLKSSGKVRSIIWQPRLTPDMLPHYWCGYCRRPTLFGNKATAAKMLNGYRMPASEVRYRCLTCGSSADLMDIRHPENNQRWDVNRPRLVSDGR